MGARLKRAAYGLNDAPRLWWNRLDNKLRSYGLVPTRADRCCYVFYSTNSSSRSRVTWATDEQQVLQQLHDTNQPAPAIWEAKSLSGTNKTHHEHIKLDLDGALELLLDPITGSNAKNKTVDGVITIYVDDAFFTGNDLSLIHI